MRTLTIVCLIAVMLSLAIVSPALADRSRGGKPNWVGLGLAALVLLLADDDGGKSAGSDCQTPQSYAPAPESLWRSSRTLGNVLLREVSGSSSTRWVAGEVLGAAGWSVLVEEDRQAALNEQRRYGGNGQVAAAGYFASIRSEFKAGSTYDRGQATRSSSSYNRGNEVICTVFLRIADGAGHSFQAQGVGSSWSRYDSFNWRSCGYTSNRSDYTPNDQDLALLAAMVAASNRVSSQASMVASPPPPAFTDTSRERIGNAGAPQAATTATAPAQGATRYCGSCGAEIYDSRAKFCPYDGKELPR